MSVVPTQRLAISVQVGCGIMLGACFANLCGCNPVCDGSYTVDVNYANTDTDNIHIFVSGKETFDARNRIVPGGTRHAEYADSFFQPVYSNPFEDPTESQASVTCFSKEEAADDFPHTWQFQAGRNGQVLGDASVTIEYRDVIDSHTYAVNVSWDGTTLVVTKR